MKRIILLLSALVLVFALVPSVSAGTPTPNISPLSAEWVQACGSGLGLIAVGWGIYAPAGYTIKWTDSYTSAAYGSWTESYEQYVAYTYSYNDYGVFFVYPDGTFDRQWTMYAPTGVLAAQAELYGSCLTGEVWFHGGTIFDIAEPDPSERVMGHVLADTPLYSEANPATVRAEVLKGGQTWFVVGSKTGTDGNEWYEVFVGGVNTAFVPASAMTLDGPIP